MSDHPFLSIIIPIYNTEKYLTHCLDSILAQDFTDYELILVDDGSTDSSAAICDRYAEAHSQIRCLHQPNGGHTCARQNGVRISRGEYITFVDSDDWICSGMYSHMCDAARTTHADIVHCNMTAVMPHKEELRDVPFSAGLYSKTQLEETVYPRMIYTGVFFKFGIAPGLVNKLFRHNLLKKYLFQVPHDIVVGEDGPVTYSCMLAASSVYFCKESYYYYRSNPDSLCHQMDNERLAENHTMFETYERLMDTASYPHVLTQLYYFSVYQSLLTYIPIFRSLLPEYDSFKQTFLSECNNRFVKEAFSHVPVKDITGLHNKLYALCIRHKLCGLFRLLLRY